MKKRGLKIHTRRSVRKLRREERIARSGAGRFRRRRVGIFCFLSGELPGDYSIGSRNR